MSASGTACSRRAAISPSHGYYASAEVARLRAVAGQREASVMPANREAVAGALNRLIDGKPRFQLAPGCTMLRKGFAGGYHFRRVKVAGDERYHDGEGTRWPPPVRFWP